MPACVGDSGNARSTSSVERRAGVDGMSLVVSLFRSKFRLLTSLLSGKDFCGHCHHCRQLTNRLVFENQFGSQAKAGPGGARNDLHHQNGVAAKVKKVVVAAD